jgi:hypothetical protein
LGSDDESSFFGDIMLTPGSELMGVLLAKLKNLGPIVILKPRGEIKSKPVRNRSGALFLTG